VHGVAFPDTKFSCTTHRHEIVSPKKENGAGVEILENKPANHPEMGDGIYTLKHYHIDRRFPGWLRAIAPKVSPQKQQIIQMCT